MGYFDSTVTTQNKTPPTTYAAAAVLAFGNGLNNHPTATRVLEGATTTVFVAQLTNTLVKKLAPAQHERFVAKPLTDYVVTPLQNRGVLAKGAEGNKPAQRGWIGSAVNVLTLGTAGYFKFV